MFYDEYGETRDRSARCVRVVDTADPGRSRTLRMPRDAPERWVHDAYLVATGRAPDPLRYDEPRMPDGLVLVDARPPGSRDDPFDWYRDPSWDRLEAGEPLVQILDDEEPGRADAAWESAPAPYRRAHVQQELTRMFGVLIPQVDTSGRAELSEEIGSARVTALLLALPPERRLALRAHLHDSGMLRSTPMDAGDARALVAGLRWLVERLEPDGIEQDAHGGMPAHVAREAEAALDWTPVEGAPPSPGHALIALARRVRFTRRLKGRIITVSRARAVHAAPFRPVALARAFDDPGRHWSHDHTHTLALLAVADGSGSDAASIARRTAEGMRALEGSDGYGDDEGSVEAAAQRMARSLMEVLAPLGGPGAYGAITPGIRQCVRDALFTPRLPGDW